MSDGLIIAMIVVYAVALFLFAVEAAYGRKRQLRANRLMPGAAGAATGAAPVRAGSSAASASSPDASGTTDAGYTAPPASAAGGIDLDAAGAGGGADDDLSVSVRREEPEASAAQHAVGRAAVFVTMLGFLLHAAQLATRGVAAARR